MVTFLLVTAILNLAIGYGLGRYFNGAATTPLHAEAEVDADIDCATLAPTQRQPLPHSQAGDEQNLLAGIEGFRNQLAGMQGMSSGVAVPTSPQR